MRIAVLADIHGNSWALRAVLEHAEAQGFDLAVNLGDIFYGPLDPAGTAAILAGRPMPTVAGNQDRMLLERCGYVCPDPGDSADAPDAAAAPPNPTLERVVQELPWTTMNWLAGLPWALTLSGDVLLCHGTPRDDACYLLEDVSSGRPEPLSAPDVEAALCGWDYSLVLCGHSHLPRSVDTGRRLVVNPGSVGLPAYSDADPPHAISCGSPHARYALVERAGGGWRAEFHSVDYDWLAAADQAQALGREDWARALATGRAECR